MPWYSVLAYAAHGYNVTRHWMTEQAPFTMLLTKETNINTLSSSIHEDMSTVREQANKLEYGKRIKIFFNVKRINGRDTTLR